MGKRKNGSQRNWSSNLQKETFVPDCGSSHQHLGFPFATRGKAWQNFSRCAKCTQSQMHRVYHFTESHFNVRHKGASCVLGNWRNSQSLSVTSPRRTIVHCPLLLARPHPTAFTYPPILSPIDLTPLPHTHMFIAHPSLLWRRSYGIVLFCPFLMCCVQGLRTKHVLSQARDPDPPNHLGMWSVLMLCSTRQLWSYFHFPPICFSLHP